MYTQDTRKEREEITKLKIKIIQIVRKSIRYNTKLMKIKHPI